MSEFDIRIGTQLDTSEAEAKLAALVSKYNDTPINLSVNVNGAEKLTALQNSLTKISTLAKGLGNIKVDVGSNVGSISADMSDKIKTDISALIKSTDSVTKQLGEGTVKALGNSTNKINKQLDSTKNKIDNMISNLQNIKLTGLKDGTGEIDKTINKLKEIKSLDFGKLDKGGISKVNSDLSKLNDTYKQLITSAKSNQLQSSFNSIKIDPLLKQMEAVRDVLSAKNMDTSWINNLINKMNTLKSSSADLSSIKNSFKGLKDEFSNLTKSMDVKGITSVETALRSLTKYRNELNNKITMAVDDSEVKQLKASLEQVDNAISKMKQSLAFGASSNAMGQLIDSSQLQNAENMKKKVEEIGKALDGFKQKSQQLKGQEFVDISKLMAVDSYIQKIENDINKLDFKNINAGDVQKIANDMKVLENAIQQTSNASKNLKLEAKFDADFSKVEQQLNGLHSALIKAGGDTSAINQLKQQLNSIKDLSKTSDGLSRASADLNKLGESIKKMGSGSDLGKIQGDIKQYLDYVKQLQNAQKQLANTKDTNIAKGIESEISRIKSAMSQLENGFDSTQKKIASGFKESFKSQDFTSEINKMQSALQKLQSVANSMGQNSIFSNLTSEGGKLSAEFNKLQSDISQLGQKLQQALKLGNIDASGVQKLQQEIMQTADSAEKLSKIAVNVECDEAISSLNKLEQEMKQTEESSERLKNLKSTYSGIADQVNNGTKSFAQATKEINSANKESNNFATSIGKAGSQVGGMTSKIEGAFSSIKNAFSDVGLGMLLANGVSAGVQAIKSTIVDLDASLADLKRVLPDNVSPTVDNLKGITADAKQIAIDVGQSTENVIQGMAVALQAGATNMQQASEIAKSSAIFQNVTDMSAQAASESIAGMINQYYGMDKALAQVNEGVGRNVKGYNNLTQAMDLVLISRLY